VQSTGQIIAARATVTNSYQEMKANPPEIEEPSDGLRAKPRKIHWCLADRGARQTGGIAREINLLPEGALCQQDFGGE
jgi:hypothetical protein